MGKKKSVNLNGEPLRDVPFTEGVQITYKHNTIAQSADTVEYALETGGKAVEANIGVAYIAPDKFPFIIPINFDSTSPLSGTVAFTTDKRADAMNALRAGRPLCVQIVGSESPIIPVSGMICLNSRDYSDTDLDNCDLINNVEIEGITTTGGNVTAIGVMNINLGLNTWTAVRKAFS